VSRENVEVARRAYETFNARHLGLACMHSADVELHDQTSTFLEDAVHRGHAEIQTWLDLT
jgi:hypothetical protein